MFQFIIPEILAEARSLSMGALGMCLALGVFLWLFGWWSHRFWVVLITTVLAGIFGLYESSAFQAHQLLAGLLLALAAGLLALHLVRVLAFLAGGLAGLWAAQAVVPNLTQSLICFLLFGILGSLLFRVWMMGLTSLAGTLLTAYASLSLFDRAGTMDAVAWTAQASIPLNWGCGLFAVIGVGMQYLLDRRRRRKLQKAEKPEEEPRDAWDVLASHTWNKYRKAG
jgi:hypothetical protein